MKYFPGIILGFYMPWTRGWKAGFRMTRDSDMYMKGYRAGRRYREREGVAGARTR